MVSSGRDDTEQCVADLGHSQCQTSGYSLHCCKSYSTVPRYSVLQLQQILCVWNIVIIVVRPFCFADDVSFFFVFRRLISEVTSLS